MPDRIYLDAITTTRPTEQVIRAGASFYDSLYGSTASPHQMGQELQGPIDMAENRLYELFSLPKSTCFVFTSSGAEATTQVIVSVLRGISRKIGKNHFVVRSIDEAPSILACSHLEEEGCFFKFALCNTHGFCSLQDFEEVISPRTALISVCGASALTGALQPLEELAKLCKTRGILLHVDATHLIGKWPLEEVALLADYITFNGEQFHAPKGTGGLFAKEDAPLFPLIFGEEELVRFRGGPLNVAALISLGQAAYEAQILRDLYGSEVARLRGLFEEIVLQGYPEAVVLFSEQTRLPHCSCIVFPGIESELLAFALNRKGIYACIGGGALQKISKVVGASYTDPLFAQCGISFSLTKETQEDEIERASKVIIETAKRLRKLSRVFT
jgi:cysteine desulfurase